MALEVWREDERAFILAVPIVAPEPDGVEPRFSRRTFNFVVPFHEVRECRRVNRGETWAAGALMSWNIWLPPRVDPMGNP